MRTPNGQIAYLNGVIKAVGPPSRLGLPHHWEGAASETVVTLEFIPQAAGKTKLLLTLTVRTKKHVHLFFQQGVLLGERFGILEGEAEQVRVARFHTMAEVEANKGAIEAVVRAWVALQDG